MELSSGATTVIQVLIGIGIGIEGKLVCQFPKILECKMVNFYSYNCTTTFSLLRSIRMLCFEIIVVLFCQSFCIDLIFWSPRCCLLKERFVDNSS